MDTTELSKLAAVLRKNGADVFSGCSKFTLSLDLLVELNNSFALIVDQRDSMNSSFHVINPSSEKVETFRDMHFLHDFIQRSSSLKLSPPYTATKPADISHFKNLKLLEVHSLNLDSIHGIETVRSHLQSLVCTRCLKDMKSVLNACGGDQCEEDMKWDDLREVVFTHNHLTNIESLSLMPNLHTLNLSHNDIESADVLNELINLKHLNLSYNKLIKVPQFTGNLCNRLQILVLCYNFIEDITSVSSLTNLRELDVSENCIVEHKALVPVANLATLQLLNLCGNPLSYHPQHRPRSTCYLHGNTSTVRFLLDGKLLSKTEKQLTGSLHPRMRIRTTSNTSTASIVVEKPRRVRNVTITDNEYTPIMENDHSEEFSASLLLSGEHLDAKRQIEQLKQQYGEHWLKDHAGSLVQDVLGIDKSPVSSTPYDSLMEDEVAEQALPEEPAQTLNIPAETENAENTQTFVTASDTFQDTLQPDDTNGLYETAQTTEVQSPCDVPSEDDDIYDGDVEDGEENIFLATLVDSEDSVFIVITETHILERESTRSKELSRWPIETLVTCENDEKSISIYFDTMRRDAKSRQYQWDSEESPKLLIALRALIANKPDAQSSLTVYKCLKCSTQFGVELAKTLADDKDGNKCPACGSKLVFEDD